MNLSKETAFVKILKNKFKLTSKQKVNGKMSIENIK